MDISDTLAPTSDQLDAVDLLSGPRTFTIKGVSAGAPDQPVNIALTEFPRVWRPGKSMRRVLVAAWGPDASQYVGRRVTLYCDPEVKFGGDKVGGTRISHMTDLPGGRRLSVPLLISRGKSAMYVVEPLTKAARAAAPPTTKPTPEQMREIADGFAAAEITDNAGKAKFLADAVGREMSGWGDLTADDAVKVIDALKRITAPLSPDDPWSTTQAAVNARDEQEVGA